MTIEQVLLCAVALWVLCGVAATPIGCYKNIILPKDAPLLLPLGALIGPLAMWIVLSMEKD